LEIISLVFFFFCHRDFLCENQAADIWSKPLANPQLYVDYYDPFNCECRAYGRLKEERREDLAVRALGYLLLTHQQEADLAMRVEGQPTPAPSADAATLDGDNFWGQYEQHRGLPVRAIVKELVPCKHPDPAQAPRMWKDLQALHSLDILVNDTHGGNYLDGKLVDFSRSWTIYHPSLDQITAGELESLMWDELKDLLDYYYEVANSGAGSGIIPRDLEGFCSSHYGQYTNIPTTYNWLRWAKDPGAEKAYVEQMLFGSAAC
jgi:hypothetical protein